MNIISYFLIKFIKFYQLFISPLLGHSCRYLPTCSEYLIESLKIHGPVKGIFLGSKRLCKCHRIKFLGGDSGLDLVPKKQVVRKKN